MPNQYNDWETERGRYGSRPEEQGRAGRGYRGEEERNFFGGEDYERRAEEGRYGERRFGGEGRESREQTYSRSYEPREHMRSYEEDWRSSGEFNREPEQSGGTRSWALSGRADERGASREQANFGERTSRSEGYSTQDRREGYGGQSWREEPGAFGHQPRTREREFWDIPGPHAGRGPQGYKRSDERITEDVNECLTRHGMIDATQINVTVKDGEVTLSGTVSDRQAKRLAEDAVESCSGVKEVQNQLRVKQEGQTAQQGQTSTGQQTQTEQKRNAAKQ